MNLDLTKYEFSFGAHRNREVIWIAFPFDRQLLARLKKNLPMVRWSQSQKKWYVADQPHFRQLLALPPREYKGKDVLSKIPPRQSGSVTGLAGHTKAESIQ